jgi:gamma-glutamyltranspeptidase
MIETARGGDWTGDPGADGQVQTLLQVLLSAFADEIDLAQAVSRPR